MTKLQIQIARNTYPVRVGLLKNHLETLNLLNIVVTLPEGDNNECR